MRKLSRNWCLYILNCRDGTLYTGVTTDIDKRLKRHNSGKGAKYTRGRRPVCLVYLERDLTEGAARRREREIKSWRRQKKAALVESFGF